MLRGGGAVNTTSGTPASPGSSRGSRSLLFGMVAMFVMVTFTITMPPQVRPAGYNQYPLAQAESMERRIRLLELEKQRAGQLLHVAGAEDDETQHKSISSGSTNVDAGTIARRASLHVAASSSSSGSGSTIGDAAVARKIDLTLFVVFHKKLYASLYEGLDWSALRRLQPSKYAGNHANMTSAEERETAALVDFLEESPSSNQTTLIFLATNKNILKSYDPSITNGRLLYEHLMPGFDETIGAMLHEHGAMNTIFFSNITHALPPGFYGPQGGGIVNAAAAAKAHDLTSGSARARFKASLQSVLVRTAVAADHDNDGVQEWIGVFQHDMHIDAKLIALIRRRIVQRTVLNGQGADALGGIDAAAAGLSALQAHQLRRRQRLVASSSSSPSSEQASGAPQLCCIFYALSYPTVYMLGNPLGYSLLADYNRYFNTTLRLRDLPPQVVLDVFVVPSVVFNRMLPFLHSVMERLVAGQRFPSQRGEGRTAAPGSPPPRPLDVMERALAVALGAEATRFVMVQIPLRHEKPDSD